MIPKEYVREESKKVLRTTNETEKEFLERVMPKFIEFLKEQSPTFWKNYGMYWYNLKELMKNYAPKQYREYVRFVGGEDNLGNDIETGKEYDYGSDIDNWTSAQLYLMQRAENFELGDDNLHLVTDEDWETKIYDPEVGFINNQWDS